MPPVKGQRTLAALLSLLRYSALVTGGTEVRISLPDFKQQKEEAEQWSERVCLQPCAWGLVEVAQSSCAPRSTALLPGAGSQAILCMSASLSSSPGLWWGYRGKLKPKLDFGCQNCTLPGENAHVSYQAE